MPHDSEQHAQHDPLLVVSLAAGDLTGAERDLATSLVADCAECATLQDDLLAIARATAALPTAVRPRDFQLTPEQAARLRPLGWRRFVAAFASPRLAMTRQLGIGLTTLGLAGLLVSALPTVNLGMGGAASASSAPAAALQATEDTEFSGRVPGIGGCPNAFSGGVGRSRIGILADNVRYRSALGQRRPGCRAVCDISRSLVCERRRHEGQRHRAGIQGRRRDRGTHSGRAPGARSVRAGPARPVDVRRRLRDPPRGGDRPSHRPPNRTGLTRS